MSMANDNAGRERAEQALRESEINALATRLGEQPRYQNVEAK